MTREDLINQRAITCRHGGHCEWIACDKCNHYESKPETITNSTSSYLEVVLSECDDCISRQAVLDLVVSNHTKLNELNVVMYAPLCKDIKNLPSVTPKEKTGHWIDDEFGSKCSYCGIHTHLNKFDRPMKFKYCSMCGAKMVEPQESEDKE